MGWPNVFGSLAECMATCPGARPAVAACDFSYEQYFVAECFGGGCALRDIRPRNGVRGRQ
jgi:hypothetical protein